MPVKRSVQKREAKAAPKITPARQWKRQPQTYLRTLPSGNTALLRRVSLVEIATTGKLPEPLSALIGEVIEATLAKQDVGSAEWQEKWQAKTASLDYATMLKLIDDVVPLVFVEPRIVIGREPDYDAGEIALGDVDPDDRGDAFVAAFGEVGLLVDFFQKPAGGVPAP
jgi:hypothetical protein